MKILIAGFQHETNTFAPTKAKWEDFVHGGGMPSMTHGEDVFKLRGINIPIAGFLNAMHNCSHELVPVIWANACPSAEVTEDAYERISDIIVGAAAKTKPDGVYLDIHGAMVAEHVNDGEGELSDAASVLDWLQQYNTNSKICWVAGFSFGSWVAMQLLMRRPELNGFVSISPPANVRDFSFLAPCPSSGLIVHGDKDNIASFDSSKILAEKLQKQKKVDIKFKPIKGADHFYENYSEEFSNIVDSYIKDSLKS